MSFPYEDFVQHIQTIKDYVDNKTPELPGSFPVATEVIDVNLSAFDFTRTDLAPNLVTPFSVVQYPQSDGLGCWTPLSIRSNEGEETAIPHQIQALSGSRSPILLTLKNQGGINVDIDKFQSIEMPVKAGDSVEFAIKSTSNITESASIYDLVFINSYGTQEDSALTKINDTAHPWTVENNNISITIKNGLSSYIVKPTVDGTIKFRTTHSGSGSTFFIYHNNAGEVITKKICCQYSNNTEGGVQYIDIDSNIVLFLSTDTSSGATESRYNYSDNIQQVYIPSDSEYSLYNWTITEFQYTSGAGYGHLFSFAYSAKWTATLPIELQSPFSARFVPDIESTAYISANNVSFETTIEPGKITITSLGQLMPKLSGKLYITQTDKFGDCIIDTTINNGYKKINSLPIVDNTDTSEISSLFKKIGKNIYRPATTVPQTTYQDAFNTLSDYSRKPLFSTNWREFKLSFFSASDDLWGVGGLSKVKLNETQGFVVSSNTRFSHIVDSIPLCKLSVTLGQDSKGSGEPTFITLDRDPTIGDFYYAGSTYPSGDNTMIKWRYDKVIKENNILYNTESSTYTLTFTKNGTVSFLYQDDYPGGSYHQNSIKISKNGADLVTGYAPMSYTEFSQSVSAGDTILITASKVNAQARFYIKDITFSEPDGMTQENNETAPWQVKSEVQSFSIRYCNGIGYYYNEIEEFKGLYVSTITIRDDTTVMYPIGAYEQPLSLDITMPAIMSVQYDILDCGIWFNMGTFIAYTIIRGVEIKDRSLFSPLPYIISIKDNSFPDISVNGPRPMLSGNSIKIIDKDYLTAFNEGLVVKPIVGANIAIPPAIKGQFLLRLELSWATDKSSSLMTVSPPMGDSTTTFAGFPVFNVAEPFIEYYKDIGYSPNEYYTPILTISDAISSDPGGEGLYLWGYLPITDKYNNAFINLGHDADESIVLGELVSKNPFTLTVSVYSIPSQTDKYTGTLLKDAWHTYTFEGETTTDVYSSTTDYLDYNHKVAVNDVIDISYNSGGNYGSGERKGYINNLVFTPDDTSKIGTDYMVITNSDATHPWVVNSDGTITVEIDETYYSTHYNIKFTTPGTVSLQYKCGGRGNIDIERTTAGVTVWAADIKKAPTANDATDNNIMSIDNPYYFGICDSELTINYPYEIYMDTLYETDSSYTLRAIYTGETKPDKDMDYELLCRTNTRVYTSQDKVQLKVNNNYNWFADAVTAVFGEQ